MTIFSKFEFGTKPYRFLKKKVLFLWYAENRLAILYTGLILLFF